MDLNAAQAAKFEHICRKLRLKSGERLLDIGCGWGGLVVYAAEKCGVQATGITLSQPQVDYGQEWIRRSGLIDRAAIELRDYRDLDPANPYDKIVSLGMVEHVGQTKLTEYFQAAVHGLRPGGLFMNHAIATHCPGQDGRFERTYRTWRLYMSASAQGFESGRINVYQTLLSKNREGVSEVPLTRADLYGS